MSTDDSVSRAERLAELLQRFELRLVNLCALWSQPGLLGLEDAGDAAEAESRQKRALQEIRVEAYRQLHTMPKEVPDSQAAEAWLAGVAIRSVIAQIIAIHRHKLEETAKSQMSAALHARMTPEDLVQQASLQAIKNASNFEAGDGGLAARFWKWLGLIIRHAAIDVSRRQSPDFCETVVREAELQSLTPSKMVSNKEAEGVLLNCLAQLSADHQLVLKLRFWEHRSTAEIAAALSSTEGAAKMMLARARVALRDEIGRSSLFYPATNHLTARDRRPLKGDS